MLNGLLMEKKKEKGSISSALCLIFVIRRENGAPPPGKGPVGSSKPSGTSDGPHG